MAKRRRLAKITPEACLAAVTEWFETELKITAAEGRVFVQDGMTWLELRNLTTSTFDEEEQEADVIRALLSKRAYEPDQAFADPVLLINLHERDPTPRRREIQPGVIETDTPYPYRSLAIVALPDGVEAREYSAAPASWGVQISWPFSD